MLAPQKGFRPVKGSPELLADHKSVSERESINYHHETHKLLKRNNGTDNIHFAASLSYI